MCTLMLNTCISCFSTTPIWPCDCPAIKVLHTAGKCPPYTIPTGKHPMTVGSCGFCSQERASIVMPTQQYRRYANTMLCTVCSTFQHSLAAPLVNLRYESVFHVFLVLDAPLRIVFHHVLLCAGAVLKRAGVDHHLAFHRPTCVLAHVLASLSTLAFR